MSQEPNITVMDKRDVSQEPNNNVTVNITSHAHTDDVTLFWLWHK